MSDFALFFFSFSGVDGIFVGYGFLEETGEKFYFGFSDSVYKGVREKVEREERS